MSQHNKPLFRFKKLLDLSSQAVPGVPIVEMAGNRRVLIENHNGVAQYSNDRITVVVKMGRIIVSGRDLEICHMSKQQLVIVGYIDTVSVERGCH